jgi:PRTRC genetic system protein C
MTIETMTREFRYGELRLGDPNPKLSIEEVRAAFSVSYPEISTATGDWTGGCWQQTRVPLREGRGHEGMKKAAVLAKLSHVTEGRNGETSGTVRKFKTCPEFQQACHILARALERNRYGRKPPTTKAPAGLVIPG